MISATLLYASILVGSIDADDVRPRLVDLETYKTAVDQARRDPVSQIKLALWCEAHGLSAERIKHLSLAVLSDPANSLARGLLGLINYQGKWKRPDDVARAAQDDPAHKAKVAEYLDRRARTKHRAQDQWNLALWCEENGLKEQAAAHFHQVVRLDPSREAAWKRLGFKKIDGKWDTPAHIAAHKAEVHQHQQATKHWKPLLEKWRDALAGRDKAKRADAEKALADVTDPRAVPAIWSVFVPGVHAKADQRAAAKVLGQIDSPGSSRALTMLALTTPFGEVRQIATQTLRRRDPRDFASLLIGFLRDKIKYEVRPVNGPGSTGQLVIKNPDANLRRLYSPPPMQFVPMQPGDQMTTDANGLPVINRVVRSESQFSVQFTGSTYDLESMLGLSAAANASQFANALGHTGISPGTQQKLVQMTARGFGLPIVVDNTAKNQRPAYIDTLSTQTVTIPVGQMMMESQKTAMAAEQQLEGDVQAIDTYNSAINDGNRLVRQVLGGAIGTDLGDDRIAWEKWVTDLAGYAFASTQNAAYEPPTYDEQVPLDYQPTPVPVIATAPQVMLVTIARHSCFAAGTPVQTMDGPRSIESLRVGDEVLTQDPRTGALKYQPLLEVYHNPPNATLKVDLERDAIVLTGIHRLWIAGKGWAMARELKPGDRLRTLEGIETVRSVNDDSAQPVFNLRVADGESFFVGKTGVLAHDNSTVNPTPNPFDAVADLTTTARP